MTYSELAKRFDENFVPLKSKLLWPFPSQVSFDASHQIVVDSKKSFSEEHFGTARLPIDMGKVDLSLPSDNLYVLRMPIRQKYSWAIPSNLNWLSPVLEKAGCFQHSAFETYLYPYVYITIRHGEQKEYGTEVWHTDGFQGDVKARHVGEISYIWTSDGGTEWGNDQIKVPVDFDPANHNFFSLLDRHVFKSKQQSKAGHLYCFDSYCVHRKQTKPGPRTMIRLTFSNVEIKDPNYTENPFFKLSYSKAEPRDAIKNYTGGSFVEAAGLSAEVRVTR